DPRVRAVIRRVVAKSNERKDVLLKIRVHRPIGRAVTVGWQMGIRLTAFDKYAPMFINNPAAIAPSKSASPPTAPTPRPPLCQRKSADGEDQHDGDQYLHTIIHRFCILRPGIKERSAIQPE